jgi:hypothetical protein
MSERFEVHQEEDSVPSRTLIRVGFSVVLISALAVAVSTALLGRAGQARLGGGPAERVAKHGEVAPPTLGLIEQTLIDHEERGLEQRRFEEARLRSYGWVDRPGGVAHIPIDRAMALVVDENRADGSADGDGGGR